MADEAMTTQEKAAEAILDRIAKMAPKVGGAAALADLGEAYALVTGKIKTRAPKTEKKN